MEESKVIHETIGAKYRIVYEQAASTKGVIGFKVEANGDDLASTYLNANELLRKAKEQADIFTPKVEIK
jgi:ribosomal protein S3